MLGSISLIAIIVLCLYWPINFLNIQDHDVKILINGSINSQLFENNEELSKRLKHGQHLTITEQMYQLYTSYHRATEVTIDKYVAAGLTLLQYMGAALLASMFNYFFHTNMALSLAICFLISVVFSCHALIKNTRTSIEEKEDEYFENIECIFSSLEIDYELKNLNRILLLVENKIEKLQKKKENNLLSKTVTLFMVPILIFSTEQLLMSLVNNISAIVKFFSSKENWILLGRVIENAVPAILLLTIIGGLISNQVRKSVLPEIHRTYFLDQSLTLNQAIIAKRILQRTIYEFNAEPKLLSMQ